MPKIKSGIIGQIREKFIDLMALLVAVVAVIISMKQGNIQKKLEIVNKQPLLAIELIKTDSIVNKGFLLQNVGFGPAIIKSFRFYLDQADYKKNISYQSWLDSNNNTRFRQDVTFIEVNNLTESYVVTTNPPTPLFLLRATAKSFFNSLSAENMGKIIIEIEYQSISPFDKNIYYLRFCENFIVNNIRDRPEINSYE